MGFDCQEYGFAEVDVVMGIELCHSNQHYYDIVILGIINDSRYDA
jgi:hypothetical protein